MDSKLDYIRQQFKDYENNIDNEKGCHHLENALECAMEVIENSNNKDEVRISYNYINKYLEKAKKTNFKSPHPNSPAIDLPYFVSKIDIDFYGLL